MSEPVKVLPMAQLLRLAREKEERERSQSDTDRQPHIDSQSDSDSQPHTGSQSETALPGGQNDWQPDSDSQSVSDHQPPDLMTSLPKVAGHLRMPNSVTDHLFKFLTADEQAIFIQLFRLSWGFNKPTCSISNPKLSERSNVKMTSMKAAVKRLESRGLISKRATTLGYGKEQGIEYRVSHPDSQSDIDRQPHSGRQSVSDTIKEKLLKENNKKENKLALDTKSCPDCQGSGFWYPEGIEKGVAKCRHKRLGRQEK
jgi:predicted transcriptional regulator